MPFFYDLQNSFTTSGTPLTEVTQMWAKTIANQETVSLFGVYFTARGAVAGGASGRVKHNTGTTASGGTHPGGTVFELTPAQGGNWTEKVLYNFCSQTNCTDGAGPLAGLIFDAAGNLYGTTSAGGTYQDFGTVFELMPTKGGGWTEQVLHSFGNPPDGVYPSGGPVGRR